MGFFSSIALKAGDDAPDFTLMDQAGRSVTLASLRGKRVILYFYPKADTPGCTKEACSFRDAPRFPPDVVVLGVSKDSVEAQKRFSEKNRLPFPLLADSDGTVIAAYGIDGLFGFARRKTFLIDAKGKIAKVIEDVHPAIHAAEVGDALKAVR